jgi:hypothetical protein
MAQVAQASQTPELGGEKPQDGGETPFQPDPPATSAPPADGESQAEPVVEVLEEAAEEAPANAAVEVPQAEAEAVVETGVPDTEEAEVIDETPTPSEVGSPVGSPLGSIAETSEYAAESEDGEVFSNANDATEEEELGTEDSEVDSAPEDEGYPEPQGPEDGSQEAENIEEDLEHVLALRDAGLPDDASGSEAEAAIADWQAERLEQEQERLSSGA